MEAENEQSARKIAEETDFSDWDAADSPYSIEPLDGPAEPADVSPLEDDTHNPAEKAEDRCYRLQIDMPLFRLQRTLLIKITDLAHRGCSYLPAPEDARLLRGLLELTDALADGYEDGGGG